MRLTLTGRQVDITPTLNQLVQTRLEKLERRFGDALLSVQVVLERAKNRFIAEVIVHARGDHHLTGVSSTKAWSTSLTDAVKKVLQQAETVKGKWEGRKRSAASVRTLLPAASVRAPRSRSRRRA